MAAEAGTEIDDASPALFSHGEQNGFGDRERRTHLVVELATQFFPRHVLERLDHIRGERVVHKYVDATLPVAPVTGPLLPITTILNLLLRSPYVGLVMSKQRV